MGIKGILITIIVMLSAVFAVINWSVLVQNAPVNLLFDTLNLPIGLTLLILSVALSFLFFFVSLIDRASQLRQITHLENNLEKLQARLSKRQQDEVAELDEHLSKQLENLVAELSTSAERLEQVTRSSLNDFESQTRAQFERLEERVLLVRNELAADIGVVEDCLRKEVLADG